MFRRFQSDIQSGPTFSIVTSEIWRVSMERPDPGGQRQMMPLQSLLHKSLDYCERSIASATVSDLSSYLARSKLQEGLRASQILTARALIAIRWARHARTNPQITRCLARSPGRLKLSLPSPSPSHPPSLPSIPDAPVRNIPPPIATQRPISAHPPSGSTIFMALAASAVPVRIRQTSFSSQTASFRCPAEYSFTVSLNRGFLRLRAFSIAWPPNQTFPTHIVAGVTDLSNHYLQDVQSALDRLDGLFHRVFLTGQMAQIVSNLPPEFGLSLRRHENTVIFEWPSLFESSLLLGAHQSLFLSSLSSFSESGSIALHVQHQTFRASLSSVHDLIFKQRQMKCWKAIQALFHWLPVSARFVGIGRIVVSVPNADAFTIVIDKTGSATIQFELVSPASIDQMHIRAMYNISQIIETAANLGLHRVDIHELSRRSPGRGLLWAFSFAPYCPIAIENLYGRRKVTQFIAWTNIWRRIPSDAVIETEVFLEQACAKLLKLGIPALVVGDEVRISLTVARDCVLRARHSGCQIRFVDLAPLGSQRIIHVISRAYSVRAGWLMGFLVSLIQDCREQVMRLLSLSERFGIPPVIDRNDFQVVALQICSERVILSLYHHFELGGETNGHAYYRSSGSIIPAFVPRFPALPSVQAPDDPVPFVCTMFSLIRILRTFGPPGGDWTVIDPTDTRPFLIVYRRRFSIILELRTANVFLLRAPSTFPSCCLVVPLWGLARNVLPGPRKSPTVPVFLNDIEAVKSRIVTCAQLVDSIAHEGFQWMNSGDFANASFSQVIGGLKLTVIISNIKISFEWEGDSEESEVLKLFAEASQNCAECVSSITGLIRVFRTVDPDLFRVVLLVLGRLRSELKVPVSILFATMQTAVILDDGNASMGVFLDDEMVEIIFRYPFGQNGQIFVKNHKKNEPIAGVNRLFDYLRPKMFDCDI
jgi:hypothetical protein